MPLILAVKCIGKPERRNDVTRVIAAIVSPSRAEAGCISYDACERLSGESEYLFFEEWTDQEALDLHFKTPHFQEFISEFTQLLQAPPSIRIYEVAEARTLEL
jgi:quinol monooxygenase YgiN